MPQIKRSGGLGDTGCLYRFYSNSLYTDMEITTCHDNQHPPYKAHKIILSSVSSILASKISRLQPNERQIVELANVDWANLGRILDIIYKGEIRVKEADFDDFFGAMAALQIKLGDDILDKVTRSSAGVDFLTTYRSLTSITARTTASTSSTASAPNVNVAKEEATSTITLADEKSKTTRTPANPVLKSERRSPTDYSTAVNRSTFTNPSLPSTSQPPIPSNVEGFGSNFRITFGGAQKRTAAPVANHQDVGGKRQRFNPGPFGLYWLQVRHQNDTSAYAVQDKYGRRVVEVVGVYNSGGCAYVAFASEMDAQDAKQNVLSLEPDTKIESSSSVPVPFLDTIRDKYGNQESLNILANVSPVQTPAHGTGGSPTYNGRERGGYPLVISYKLSKPMSEINIKRLLVRNGFAFSSIDLFEAGYEAMLYFNTEEDRQKCEQGLNSMSSFNINRPMQFRSN